MMGGGGKEGLYCILSNYNQKWLQFSLRSALDLACPSVLNMCATNDLTRWFKYACPWSERSGFKPWPGTPCCVLGQDT